MVGDSFKAFFAQEMVVTGHSDDRLAWDTVWSLYSAWCRQHHRDHYSVDSTGVEAQAMLRSLGVRVSRTQSPLQLVRVRRRTEADAPFENLLEVRHVRREGDAKGSSSGSEESV